jgi:hypothetical protein
VEILGGRFIAAVVKFGKIETQKSPINTMNKSALEKNGEGENSETRNSHGLFHDHLKVACLPIPPYARPSYNETNANAFRKGFIEL